MWVRIPSGAWMFAVSVVRCQVEVSATSWSLFQRSPTDCGASLCDLETREWGGHGPLGVVAPKTKNMDGVSSPHYTVSSKMIIMTEWFGKECGWKWLVLFWDRPRDLAIFLCRNWDEECEPVNPPPLCAMTSYTTEWDNKSFQNMGTIC